MFRTAGNKANETRIVAAVTGGQSTDEFKSPEYTNDAANALKKWLRELPEPLVPMKMYNTFIEAGTDVQQLQAAVSGLPPESYKCLHILCEYLQTIMYAHRTVAARAARPRLLCAPLHGAWCRFRCVTSSLCRCSLCLLWSLHFAALATDFPLHTGCCVARRLSPLDADCRLLRRFIRTCCCLVTHTSHTARTQR